MFTKEEGEGVHPRSIVALLVKSKVNVTSAFLEWCFSKLTALLHMHTAPASYTTMAFLLPSDT